MHSGPAWAEAAELGHDWVGDEHFLLALMKTESPAAKALAECGARYENLRDELDRLLRLDEDHPLDPTWSDCRRELTPAAHELLGWAEGFAASRGVETTTEDLLVAILWDPDSLPSAMLAACAGGRVAVKARLAELGAPVPPSDPPADRSEPQGPKVYFAPDKLDVVLRELPSLLPPDAKFGFNLNHDSTKAYVMGPPEVDMEAAVGRALEKE